MRTSIVSNKYGDGDPLNLNGEGKIGGRKSKKCRVEKEETFAVLQTVCGWRRNEAVKEDQRGGFS
jgi:hypothetical protein